MANELITVGTSAPNFTLVADNGEDITLSDYGNQSNVVLYFMREFN